MADGLSTTTANTMLTLFTAASTQVQLAVGNPGASGTSNQASVTTRMAVTWNAPSAGSVTASNQPTWTSWAGTNGQVITDLSFWNASSGGTFATSMTLSSPVTMATGDSLTLTSITVSMPTAS